MLRTLLLTVLTAAILMLGGCIKPDPEKYASVTTEALTEQPTEAPEPLEGFDTAEQELGTEELPNLPEDDYTKRY